MDALVNLEECTDYITVVNEGTEYRIKVVGTTDTPYFCGKDVCAVLGYKNIKMALHHHIDDNRKKFIKDVRQEVVCVSNTTSIGQNNLKNLTITFDYIWAISSIYN